jgi:hypothetical protein
MKHVEDDAFGAGCSAVFRLNEIMRGRQRGVASPAFAP